MIPLSATLRDRLSAPGVIPRTLVDLSTPWGVYRFSTEPCRWSGLDYRGRLMAEPEIVTALAGTGLTAPKTVRLDFANADGWFSRKPPDFFTGRPITIRQVLLDVASEPIVTFAWFGTGGQLLDPTRYQLTAEDILGPYRRELVPRDVLRVTRTDFPAIPDGSDALGRVIPVTRGLYPVVPMHFVAEGISSMTGAGALFTVMQAGGIGALTPPDEPVIYQLFDGELTQVASVRCDRLTLASGHEIAVAYQASPPRFGGGDVLPHFALPADPIRGQGVAAPAGTDEHYAARIGHEILTNSAMAGVESAYIDRDSFATAWSHYFAAGLTTRVSFDTQRTVEEVLDDFCYDARAFFRVKDRISMHLQSSRAPVGAFTHANIIAGTLRMEDIALGQRGALQRITYPRRVPTSAERAAGDDAFDVARQSVAEWSAGSGTPDIHDALFLDSRIAATRTAEGWARREAVGARRYSWESGMYGAPFEEGDLVTLTHSLVAGPRIVELETVRRQGPRLRFMVRESGPAVFTQEAPVVATLGAALPPARSLFVPYCNDSAALNPGSPVLFASSHSLGSGAGGRTPARASARWIVPAIGISAQTSFITANNSLFVTVLTTAVSANLQNTLAGWVIRV